MIRIIIALIMKIIIRKWNLKKYFFLVEIFFLFNPKQFAKEMNQKNIYIDYISSSNNRLIIM